MDILDPTSSRGTAAAVALSPRLDTLRGKRVVGLWNGREPGPGRAIIAGVVQWLDDEHGLAGSDVVQKPFYGNVAPDELLRQIVASADAVVTGVGD